VIAFPKRAIAACLGVTGLALAACSPDQPTAPTPGPQAAGAFSPELVAEVRELAVQRGIGPLEGPPPIRPQLVHLGQVLVFDKVLSGNRDIACMTCHLPAFATGDGRSLSIGQGATGLGSERVHPDGLFIPRNAPSLFNLSALQSLFWDGRVSVDANGRFHTPAGDQITPRMTRVFEFGAVSALGLFPVLSREEMRAADGNELARSPTRRVRPSGGPSWPGWARSRNTGACSRRRIPAPASIA
jgi:cytochrome c peroxidase